MRVKYLDYIFISTFTVSDSVNSFNVCHSASFISSHLRVKEQSKQVKISAEIDRTVC